MAITAERGHLESGGDRVWVEGNVLVRREAAEAIEPLELATERVLILPEAGVARTTSEVKLDSPSGRAVAAGFQLDNRARTLKLEKVRATYKTPR